MLMSVYSCVQLLTIMKCSVVTVNLWYLVYTQLALVYNFNSVGIVLFIIDRVDQFINRLE